MFREHGHTVALRFSTWSKQIAPVEKVCRERLGGSAWNREGDWCGYFGASNGHSDRRTYWISFRRESDLSFVLLSADLTK